MKSAAFALFLFPAAVLADQAQPGEPHSHGSGALSITFSGAEFLLSLAVPGADIVGFERPAENDDDRALVAVAISDLSKPLELFVLPEEAGCFAMSANVTLVGEGLGKNDETSEAASEESEQPIHTEFQADYQIQCQDIGAMNSIRFAYFDRFPNAQTLELDIVHPDETRKVEVSRATPLLDLSAVN